MPDVETSPQWADMGNNKEESVIYYRRKNGWITWGDTQPSKQIVMMRKGCTPLPQFGNIDYSEDLWGPILRSPDGPAEFPVEQVLTYRWYRKDRLPDLREIVETGSGNNKKLRRVGTQPNVVFPQLAGVKIVEYPCPENCRTKGGDDLVYHDPLHLGTHLKVMHGYDRSEIIKYGEAMGIDFSKVPGGKRLVEYDFTDAALVAAVIEREEPEFEITTVSAEQPATAALLAEIETENPTIRNDCEDCGWVNVKNTAQGLDIHKKRWCKKAAVTA